MRKVLPKLGACLSLLVLTWAVRATAQDARPFEDVKPDHWAYSAVTDLQAKGIVTGYPDHHFSGQRTLTRYEFAVALKRAIDSLPRDGIAAQGIPGTGGKNGKPGGVGTVGVAGMVPGDVEELKRLTIIFKDEMVTLGANMKEVQSKMDGLTRTVADLNHRLDRGSRSDGDPLSGVRRDRSPNGLLSDSASGRGSLLQSDSFSALHSPRLSLDGMLPNGTRLNGGLTGNYIQNGFELRSRIGGANARVFGGSVTSFNSAYRGNGLFTPLSASPLQVAHSPELALQQQLGGFGDVNPQLAAGFGGLSFGGVTTGQILGFHGGIPLSSSGEVGVTLLDLSSPNGSYLGPGASSVDNVAVYGANIRLNPFGRFAISGEASKSVTQRTFDADGNGDDNNAFLINFGYNGGPVKAAAGYQYYDPGYAAPGNWNKIGSWYNPTNVQGPFGRVGYNFSDRVNGNIGVDYLTAARDRPGFGGFTQGSSVVRGIAGVRYHFSKQFELSAEYEGVLYDISGAVSASGLRARPVEQYLTLGAGLNLTGNTVLRLAYQIINVQDASNGFGLTPGTTGTSSGSTSNASVFTTQFSIHF